MTIENEINSLRTQQITPEIKYTYYQLKKLTDVLNSRVRIFWNIIVSGSKPQLDMKLDIILSEIIEAEKAALKLNSELETLKHWILDNGKK